MFFFSAWIFVLRSKHCRVALAFRSWSLLYTLQIPPPSQDVSCHHTHFYGARRTAVSRPTNSGPACLPPPAHLPITTWCRDSCHTCHLYHHAAAALHACCCTPLLLLPACRAYTTCAPPACLPAVPGGRTYFAHRLIPSPPLPAPFLFNALPLLRSLPTAANVQPLLGYLLHSPRITPVNAVAA